MSFGNALNNTYSKPLENPVINYIFINVNKTIVADKYNDREIYNFTKEIPHLEVHTQDTNFKVKNYSKTTSVKKLRMLFKLFQ